MTQYLVSIHRSVDYNPASAEDDAILNSIDVLNEQMVAAGVRIFVGGLQPAPSARTLRAQPDGTVSVTEGPYLNTREQMGGFWVLEVANLADALLWARKAVLACRAPVEVRPLH